MMREDTLPWYRQFWPWFIIMLPASAVVAGLYTVWLAMQTSDSLVTAAESGMEIATERRALAERRASEMALDARISIHPQSGAIEVQLTGNNDADWAPTLELLFSHPTNARLDRLVSLSAGIPAADGSPRWAGHLAPVPTGRWYLVLRDGDAWRLYGVWSGAADIRLRPPTATGTDGNR